MVKHSKKQHQGLPPSAIILITMLVNRQLNDLHWVSSPWRGWPPLPNALQEMELFLPVQPRGSSEYAACSQDSAFCAHQSTAKPARCDLPMVHTSKTPDFALCIYKSCSIHPLSFSQSMVLRKSFPHTIPCMCFHSFSLFLLLLSPWSGLLPFHSTHSSFLSPNQLSAGPTFHDVAGFYFLSSCAVFFS